MVDQSSRRADWLARASRRLANRPRSVIGEPAWPAAGALPRTRARAFRSATGQEGGGASGAAGVDPAPGGQHLMERGFARVQSFGRGMERVPALGQRAIASRDFLASGLQFPFGIARIRPNGSPVPPRGRCSSAPGRRCKLPGPRCGLAGRRRGPVGRRCGLAGRRRGPADSRWCRGPPGSPGRGEPGRRGPRPGICPARGPCFPGRRRIGRDCRCARCGRRSPDPCRRSGRVWNAISRPDQAFFSAWASIARSRPDRVSDLAWIQHSPRIVRLATSPSMGRWRIGSMLSNAKESTSRAA